MSKIWNLKVGTSYFSIFAGGDDGDAEKSGNLFYSFCSNYLLISYREASAFLPIGSSNLENLSSYC